jgi:nucleoside-diphosphate-sugar epimerase
MRVIITGGAGFLGQLVASAMLDRGDDVELVDVVAPPTALATHPRVSVITGDVIETIPTLKPADLVVHLAAVVSSAAEQDFDLGLRVNLDATRAVLDRARAWGTSPVVVFASSVAVFGRDPFGPALDVITDDTLPRPQSSYGIQKFIGEQLVADYTRRGAVRGRSLRLMTVAVRPGRPNAAASSFVSGIIREPLAGTRAVCPVDAATPIIVSSPAHTVAAIVTAATVDDASWGSRTALTTPGLLTTPGEMVAALDRVAGHAASALVDWIPDPAIEAIVGSWPARFDAARARALGLTTNPDIDDVIREFVASSGKPMTP